MNSPITTHVLDTADGTPAAGIKVELERLDEDWSSLGHGTTNADGRIADLLAPGSLESGHYRANFHVAEYFQARDVDSFYPIVRIEFLVANTDQHYHIPLLLSPFGYTTYRGS